MVTTCLCNSVSCTHPNVWRGINLDRDLDVRICYIRYQPRIKAKSGFSCHKKQSVCIFILFVPPKNLSSEDPIISIGW